MIDNRATGKRVGRAMGVLDDLGLQLATMATEAHSRPVELEDRREQELLASALYLQAELAQALEDLVNHINNRDRTERP